MNETPNIVVKYLKIMVNAYFLNSRKKFRQLSLIEFSIFSYLYMI